MTDFSAAAAAASSSSSSSAVDVSMSDSTAAAASTVAEVAISAKEMVLHHSTLQHSPHIILACTGSFTAPNQHELLTVCGGGHSLCLYRPNGAELQLIHRRETELGGAIRSMATFKLERK